MSKERYSEQNKVPSAQLPSNCWQARKIILASSNKSGDTQMRYEVILSLIAAADALDAHRD